MYKLTREKDSKVLIGKSVNYVNWLEDGRADSMISTPSLGYSLILDIEKGFSYTWLTTVITSLEQIGEQLHFTTENSKYILEKIEEF